MKISELLNGKKRFSEVNEIKLDNGDKFIVSATRYGAPEYRHIMIKIGILSLQVEYESLNGLHSTIIAGLFEGMYNEVPSKVADRYFECIEKFLEEHKDEIYSLIAKNIKSFNSMVTKVKISMNSIHGASVCENISFIKVDRGEGKLIDVYGETKKNTTYIPKCVPSKENIVSICNKSRKANYKLEGV